MKLFTVPRFRKVTAALLFFILEGIVSAQGFNFTGKFLSGLTAHLDDDESTLRIHSLDGNHPTFAIINGSYTHIGGIAGINMELRAYAFGQPAQEPSLFSAEGAWVGFNYAYGWLRTFDQRFTLYGGKINNETFFSNGGLDTDLGEGTGLLGIYNVLPMFDIGLGAYSTLSDSTTIENARFVISASYNIWNIVKVYGIFRNHNTFGKADYEDQAAFLGFKITDFLGVGLTNIVFDFELENIGGFDTSGIFKMGQRFDWNKRNIYIGGWFEQYLYQAVLDASTYFPDLRFWFWTYYRFGEGEGRILPRLDLCYVYGSGGFNETLGRGRDGMNFGQHTKGRSVLQIRPEIQFRFGNALQFIKIGYALWKDLSDNAPGDSLDHAIYADFRVAF
jgi:hypothetical protein